MGSALNDSMMRNRRMSRIMTPGRQELPMTDQNQGHLILLSITNVYSWHVSRHWQKVDRTDYHLN